MGSLTIVSLISNTFYQEGKDRKANLNGRANMTTLYYKYFLETTFNKMRGSLSMI